MCYDLMIMNTFEARKEQIKRNKTTHLQAETGRVRVRVLSMQVYETGTGKIVEGGYGFQSCVIGLAYCTLVQSWFFSVVFPR